MSRLERFSRVRELRLLSSHGRLLAAGLATLLLAACGNADVEASATGWAPLPQTTPDATLHLPPLPAPPPAPPTAAPPLATCYDWDGSAILCPR